MLGRVRQRREKGADRGERALAVCGTRVLEAHTVHGVADGRRELRLERGRIVGGVGAGRERHDAHAEALSHGKLHAAQGRVLAGRVGVEAEEEPLRQPLQLPQLRLGQRRPHRGDDRREPRLPQREHVGVSLDDHAAVLLRDRLPRGVEPVEQVALAEQLALARVDVLRRQRVVVVELARLEAADAAAGVGEREHDPPLEVVVATRVRETNGRELVRGEALGDGSAREHRTSGCVAEPELAADLLAETARGEVLRARGRPARSPRGPARRTRPPARAARAAGPRGGASAPARARPPRTRARPRTGARGTRSRRRSRPARASRRTRSHRRPRRSRST